MLARVSFYIYTAIMGVIAFVRSSLLARPASMRAAGLLEYALIALLSIGLFALLYGLFRDQIESLMDTISGRIDDAGSGVNDME